MSVPKAIYVRLFLLSLLWLLFILIQYVSTYFSLYWYFWWLDIMMHTYGGFLIVASWFMVKSLGAFSKVVRGDDRRVLVLLALTVVAWEIFEYSFGIITPVEYAIDTVMDLVIGFGSGLAAFFLLRSRTIEST